jgi:predicted phage-related endonuclease
MRTGSALEPLIAAEYETQTGRTLRRFHGLLTHPVLTWAGASPDYRVVGERRLVEAKWTGSRGRFAEGLPNDVRAQASWQLLVTGYPVCDVAVLIAGEELRVFEVTRDARLEAALISAALDFRSRLEAGGPFGVDLAYVRDKYPADDGSDLVADEGLTEAVRSLIDTRTRRRELEATEDALQAAIQMRMADATRLVGPGFTCTWKKTKDRTDVDWKALAADLLEPVAEMERAALIGSHATVRSGPRAFRVVVGKEESDG